MVERGARLVTREQFVDAITAGYVGLPESELAVLFNFFVRPSRNTAPPRVEGCGVGMDSSTFRTGRRGVRKEGGLADWVEAVACLRVLAQSREPVKSILRGVFDIFAGAQLQEKQEGSVHGVARGDEGRSFNNFVESPNTTTLVNAVATTSPPVLAGQRSVPLRDTVGMFSLACSNEDERHIVETVFRHRFCLELEAIQRRKQGRSTIEKIGNHRPCELATGTADGRVGEASIDASGSPLLLEGPYSPSPRTSVHPSGVRSQPSSPVHVGGMERDGNFSAVLVASTAESEATSLRNMGALQSGRGGWVSSGEFMEALARCPEMEEVFGKLLTARLQHQHRPTWMAPILHGGGVLPMQKEWL
ncbi:unnamed protein product [Choristocarpus tenellus]